MSKTRCSHKGCVRAGGMVLLAVAKRNTLGRQHTCCGICCPKTTSLVKAKGAGA